LNTNDDQIRAEVAAIRRRTERLRRLNEKLEEYLQWQRARQVPLLKVFADAVCPTSVHKEASAASQGHGCG